VNVIARGLAMRMILVADDEPVIVKLCEQALRRSGFQVLGATDPREAIDLFETHKDSIDALVSDVVMPDLSGPQLAEELVMRKPGLGVLFISGVVPDADAVFAQLRHEFPFRFLRKPFSPALLVDVVEDMLAGREKVRG
jgi:two-component system cell cycle sensor histidine kinase/response regulator CckA